MSTPAPEPSPIEDYLDQLYLAVDGSPRDNRRLLDESAAHLYAAADELAASGTDRLHAERAAVARFGAPGVIASAQRRALRPRATAILGDVVQAGTLLGGWALIAIGVSGAFAAIMNVTFGRSFVGGLPDSYSGAQCQHFLAVQPGAGSCLRAAVLENSADAVALRAAAGVLGLLLLLGWYLTRHRRRVVPVLAVDAVGATGALGAAVVLTGLAIDSAVQHGADGMGFFLSGGLAALAVGVGFVIRFLRGVSRRASGQTAASAPNFGRNIPG